MSNRQARREQARQNRALSGVDRNATRRTARQKTSRPPDDNLFGLPTRTLVVVGAALLVLAIGAVAALNLFGNGSDEDLITSLEAAHDDIPLNLASGAKLGRDDAPLKLVEYEDFQCPFCLRYTAEDEPSIIEEYVKTGKVQIEFRHLPILGTESVQAALASECAADQGMFWQYQNRLFLEQAKEGQASAERVDVGRFSDTRLREFASEVGIQRAQFDACLSSGQHLEKISSQQQEARNLGITGTPNFVINGQAAGGDPGNIENWRRFLDTNLERIADASSPSGDRRSP